MDLWTELSKENGCYTFHTEYASQLFLKETVTYFGRCLETLTRSMLGAKDSTLAQLEALSAQDRMELIDIPNNTVYPFLNLPIPTQFARHLAMDPDAPAVIFHGQTTTRRELDQRACQIANLLAQAGAVPGCRVGIALSRSTDLVAAVDSLPIDAHTQYIHAGAAQQIQGRNGLRFFKADSKEHINHQFSSKHCITAV